MLIQTRRVNLDDDDDDDDGDECRELLDESGGEGGLGVTLGIG